MPSNETNQVSPFASFIVKPGANPACFGLTTDQVPVAGAVPVSGPRAASSTDSGRARMRFVNQLESGTSSIELILRARTSGVGVARMSEEVLGEVVEQIDLLFLRARRVLRLRLAVERIIVVELAPVPDGA